MTGLHDRHRTIIVIGGVAVIALALAVAVSDGRDATGGTPAAPVATEPGEPDGVPAAPASPTSQEEPNRDDIGGQATDKPQQQRPVLVGLPDIDDPDTYAAAVAGALHSIDHTREHAADYEALFADAVWDEIVPDAREAILDAIYTRLPGDRAWRHAADIGQHATFEVDEVWEPGLGRQGRDEQWWPPGVVVRTVTGTWTDMWQPAGSEGPRSSSQAVALTVVVACPPAASPCRLVGVQPAVEA